VPGSARVTRGDLTIALGFVLAAGAEAVVLHGEAPGLEAFALGGAPVLLVLALRRTRPVATISVISAFALFGTVMQTLLWPQASDSGGVWMFALLFASYSLGAHARGRVIALGGLLPLLVALTVDLNTMSGWGLVEGVFFVTAFVGILPTVVGRLVRVRRERLAVLERQRAQIAHEQHRQREAAVLDERVRTTERLQPLLLDGLRALAEHAEQGAPPGEIELSARQLLTRTREEVVALTARVDLPADAEPPPVDHLERVRAAAQPWSVIGAGTIAAGLAVESTSALTPTSAPWVAVVASLAVGLPLALVWWRPLPALAVTWLAAAGFSRLIAPLDGALSGTALALAAAFACGALSTRRGAIAGLVLCWVGQDVGVGADDPFGVAMIILVAWLGGLAVNETSQLVEESRANNRILVTQEAAARRRAVVEERLRLAREVHDQLGHSLTVVALQAGAARRMSSTEPDRTREALLTIAHAARAGLSAMQGDISADVDTLLDRSRAAGLEVSADVAALDSAGSVGPEQRLLAYRVVQEAVTNVLRHAPGATASVTVRRDGADLCVVVANSAPSGSDREPGTGKGLAGLRQRVADAAGTLTWGARADGGFEVRAVLPPAERFVGARP